MPIHSLDHVNVRTGQLDKMVHWYEDVLGLKSGKRPHFPFGGAWLYAGDRAYVHLVDVEGAAGAGSEVNLKLEHFAFSASDLAGFTSKLDAKGIKYSRNDLTDIGIVQINVWDPDGNHIHVDFAEG